MSKGVSSDQHYVVVRGRLLKKPVMGSVNTLYIKHSKSKPISIERHAILQLKNIYVLNLEKQVTLEICQLDIK